MAKPSAPPFHPDHTIAGQQGSQSVTTDQEYIHCTILIDARGRIESKHLTGSALQSNLNLSRLDRIHDLLWWAGRPLPARPLHRQLMLGRQIVITEQLDMHLLRTKSKIFLTPIPLVLFDHDLWKLHIANDELQVNACGLLLTYVWLVRYRSDLEIAKETGLLPDTVEMKEWNQFVTSFLEHVNPNALENFPRRFMYGELRLSRVNQIYRFAPRFRFQHLVFGYGLYPASYGTFLSRNFSWLLGIFAYISTLLAALQVGLAAVSATNEKDERLFILAAYQTSIILILAPMGLCVTILLLYITLFFFHLISALRFCKVRGRVLAKGESTLHQKHEQSSSYI